MHAKSAIVPAADPATLLAQLSAAQEQIDAATSPELDRAVASWGAAVRGLLAIVTNHAGPAPSALRLPCGTLLVAGLDRYGEVPEDGILTVIPPGSVASL